MIIGSFVGRELKMIRDIYQTLKQGLWLI